jgi:hypothetical protein
MHSESNVAVDLGRVMFGNRGRRTSTVGNRYPRTSEGQETRRTQCVL